MSSPVATPITTLDAVIVGAGFAGVYSLYALRKQGLEVTLLEAGTGVGGTWYHNRYPGARCDIESLDYSYSFDEELQQEWTWTERFAGQPEILRYINHVVDRFDLRRDIHLGVRVISAHFNDETSRWLVTADDGTRYDAKYAIMATGVLSAAQVPNLDGLDTFQGDWYHSSDWPTETVDFEGKRVGLIGTGSSGTQMIPIVGAAAKHLTVFQRTPNFCMPAANAPLDPAFQEEWKAHYPERRLSARASNNGHNQLTNNAFGADTPADEQRREFEKRWELGGHYMLRAFKDMLVDENVNNAASEFVRDKIRQIVKDPATAEKLLPKMYLGTKRLCTGTNYYETYNRPNVDLVDVRENAVVSATPEGLKLADGTVVELDIIIFATGFDAMTGSLARIDVTGRGGEALRTRWADGPRTYIGLMTHGFPNFFVMAGPGSPSVFSNMVTSIEQHVEWVNNCVAYLEANDLISIEASTAAEEFWVNHVNESAAKTLYGRNTNSWFYGANTPGKAVVFLPYVGGVGPYAKRITEIAENHYDGFELQSADEAATESATVSA